MVLAVNRHAFTGKVPCVIKVWTNDFQIPKVLLDHIRPWDLNLWPNM